MDRLDDLHAFVRLVELGSFSAAAEDLRVRQSTVSKWIAALEDELGAQLVDRTTRAIRITDPGERLYQRAQDVLAAWEETRIALGEADGELAGRVRVNVPVVFGRRFVLPALSEFRRSHPSVELDVAFNDRYVNLIDEGFDLGVRVGTPTPSSLRARTVVRTPRRLVASAAYLKARGRPMRPRDLEEHDCLLHTSVAPSAVWTFTRAGRRERARVQGTFRANHSEALLYEACAGGGIALLASWLVDGAIARGDLVPLLRPYKAPEAPVQLLMTSTRYVHPRVRALVDHLATSLPAAIRHVD
jgi:DNA-binding transcriptional LysR family regulator